MPKIEKIFVLDVTPEKFLEACNVDELKEIDFLLSTPRFMDKILNNSVENPNTKKLGL